MGVLGVKTEPRRINSTKRCCANIDLDFSSNIKHVRQKFHKNGIEFFNQVFNCNIYFKKLLGIVFFIKV